MEEGLQSPVPQVRANWLKYTVRSAKRYPAPAGPRILDSIGDTLRTAIRAAGPLGWQPAEDFIALCRAIREGVGVEGAQAFWRKSLNDSINEPFIRPLALGGLYLFGFTPAALYRRTPQAWALVTRDAGQMSTESGPETDSLLMKVRDLPPACRSMDLLYMWEGGFVGQADFTDCDATVLTDTRALERGAADFLIQWKPKGKVSKEPGAGDKAYRE
jgi:hypothetical protein